MTNFNGFQSPNFTQIPNEYLDYTFSPECDLSKIQMQIMNFVFRETFGWQDKHKILVFSATDIMALLNVKNRNQIVNALNGLVDDKGFLQSITISELPKKVRSNIEKSLGKTLQPKQKIYRLNLVEGKKRRWDNIEEPHTNIQERKQQFKGSIKNDTSIENDITGGIKSDTTSSIKNDTTLELESIGAVRVESSLNKGLNKDLNKREEEETITPSAVLSFLNEQIAKRQIANPKTLTAIYEVADKCKAIGTTDVASMQNYCIRVVEDKMSRFGQKQKVAGSKQKEMVPKWFEKNGQQELLDKEEWLKRMVNIKDTKGAVDKMSAEEKEEYFKRAAELKKQLNELDKPNTAQKTPEEKKQEIEDMLKKLRA